MLLQMNLHSTMYLLNLDAIIVAGSPFLYLHSTMYLLNLVYEYADYLKHFEFTFHYVSIKSN